MAVFVSADWVEGRLDSADILAFDPRRPVEYLQGHIKKAVNLPVTKAFNSEGRLLPLEELENWLGAAGLDDRKLPVIYDGFDGRNGAMLAWILEYLGRTDVHVLDLFLEGWIAQGREVLYRPVKPAAAKFSARVNDQVRARLEDVSRPSAATLVDFRSSEEYNGRMDTDGKPGHIPGAVNIVWKDLPGENHRFLGPEEKLRRLLAAAGIAPQDRIVAYCRTGMRAALGYLALKQLGLDVRLYDGSYAEWARSGLPVER